MSKTVVFQLRIPEESMNQCKEVAEREEIPVSFVLRRVIKRGLLAEVKPHIKNTAPTIPEWE